MKKRERESRKKDEKNLYVHCDVLLESAGDSDNSTAVKNANNPLSTIYVKHFLVDASSIAHSSFNAKALSSIRFLRIYAQLAFIIAHFYKR